MLAVFDLNQNAFLVSEQTIKLVKLNKLYQSLPHIYQRLQYQNKSIELLDC